jgi:hypothetical protein
MKISTKRIVVFHAKIATMIKAAGYDVQQAELACQSAANDVQGKEKDPKLGDVKKKAQGKEVGWREQTTVEFSGKTCTPLDFLSWHDAQQRVFTDHGEPKGDLSIGLMPDILVFWLDGMKTRKASKAEKDKAEAQVALQATREQLAANGPKRANKPAGEPAKA